MKRRNGGAFDSFFLPAGLRSPRDKKAKKKDGVSTRVNRAPLAERLRPRTLDDVVGQDEAIGPGSMLRTAIEHGYLPSLIMWGPPGCGKTTVGRILAESAGYTFVCMSAAAGGGVSEVKRTIEEAKARQKFGIVSEMANSSAGSSGKGAKTVLFLDEIHRFNKMQQDSLLKAVEDGTVILIGATTENPSFEVNSALLSRCRVVVMRRIEAKDLEIIIRKAADVENATVDDDAIRLIAELSDGDARRALNTMEMLLASTPPDKEPEPPVVPAAAAEKDDDEAPARTQLQKQWKKEEEEDNKYLARTNGRSIPSQGSSSGNKESGDDDEDEDVVVVEDSEGSQPPPTCIVEKIEVKPPHKHITVASVQEAVSSKRLLYDKAGEEHYNVVCFIHHLCHLPVFCSVHHCCCFL